MLKKDFLPLSNRYSVAAFNQSYADHPLFHRVRLMKPIEGLNAGYKQLENLQARLLAFSKRIFDYLSR